MQIVEYFEKTNNASMRQRRNQIMDQSHAYGQRSGMMNGNHDERDFNVYQGQGVPVGGVEPYNPMDQQQVEIQEVNVQRGPAPQRLKQDE